MVRNLAPTFTFPGLLKGDRFLLPVLKIAIKSSREIDRSFSYRKTLCFYGKQMTVISKRHFTNIYFSTTVTAPRKAI